ncbi:MAG TPA: hypothetical protein VE258_11220 [Ktedonobacterales bacterium]|nr:hypothetical protein [Ktedonobacterales bacterium]
MLSRTSLRRRRLGGAEHRGALSARPRPAELGGSTRIARTLTARGLAEARAAECTHCVTDWRTANLPSSRLWPRQGFRPVVYRMARLIDARVAWALAAYDLHTRH